VKDGFHVWRAHEKRIAFECSGLNWGILTIKNSKRKNKLIKVQDISMSLQRETASGGGEERWEGERG